MSIAHAMPIMMYSLWLKYLPMIKWSEWVTQAFLMPGMAGAPVCAVTYQVVNAIKFRLEVNNVLNLYILLQRISCEYILLDQLASLDLKTFFTSYLYSLPSREHTLILLSDLGGGCHLYYPSENLPQTSNFS